MMDSEVLSITDVDLEDGELSDTSDEVYTPLQRPASLSAKTASNTPTPASNLAMQLQTTKMDDDCVAEGLTSNDGTCSTRAVINNDTECQSDVSSSSSTTSSDSSDTCLTKVNKEKTQKRQKKRIKRTVMVRIAPTEDGTEQKRARFKKYDIWRAALQEDTLTENMRDCDVTQNGFNDRNVENYDYSLLYRLNGDRTNCLKRRLSNSGDELSECERRQPQSKRRRPSSRGETNTSRSSSSSKHSVHERLGKRRHFRGRRYSSANSGSDTNSYDPRYIDNMEEVGDRKCEDVAREMSQKLHEEKDDLMVRIMQILGTELPLDIYKETQRIEAEGGMTIKNRKRRRTPGGVFLFLLKHHDSLSAEDQKAIFAEDRQNANKKNKDIKSLMRERKVQELKKRLSEQGAELGSLKTRKELMTLGYETSNEQKKGNLSNPPPSPEVVEQQISDYKSLAINHVNNDVADDLNEKPSTSQGAPSVELQTYEDDFLDVNCGDMDFF